LALKKGQKLGPYEVEAPAGAGGMGEVYRARDTRLDRTVAIKVLPEHSAWNDEARIRFEREAKTISGLNHPNICTLYDVGHQDGTDYLVMEFLQGESLAERLRKGKLEVQETLQIGAQIAAALDAAHRRGLVHRDLKPGNVILTKEGAKLLDFGLAKFQVEAVEGMGNETQTTPVTGAGAIVGTLQYMSPEQLEGREADARSDIFALGATLYEMLTGERAFSGESKASLIGSIMKDVPRSISEISPLLPPALDRTIRKCLEKSPDDRWQSARDLRDELLWLGSTDAASVAVANAPARRRWRTRVVPTLLLAVAMVSTYLFIKVNQERGKAELATQSAEKRGQFLTDVLTSSFPHGYGDQTTVLDILDQASQRLNGAFPDEPGIEAELRKSLGIAYDQIDHPQQALRELTTALTLSEKVHGSTDDMSLGLMSELSWIRFVLDERRERLEILQRLESALTERFGETDERTISVRSQLAAQWERLGSIDRALEISEATWKLCTEFFGEDSSLTLDAQNQCAWLLLQSQQFDSSQKLARAAYEQAQKLYGEGDPQFRDARSLFAATYIARGAIDSAKSLYGNRESPDTYGIERVFQGDFDLTRGHYQLLVFFETWCPVSRLAMVDLGRVDRQYRQFGLNTTGMTRVNRSATDEGVIPYLKELNDEFTVVKENGRSWNYFRCGGTPSIRLLADGFLIWEKGGYTNVAIPTVMLEGMVEAADRPRKLSAQ